MSLLLTCITLLSYAYIVSGKNKNSISLYTTTIDIDTKSESNRYCTVKRLPNHNVIVIYGSQATSSFTFQLADEGGVYLGNPITQKSYTSESNNIESLGSNRFIVLYDEDDRIFADIYSNEGVLIKPDLKICVDCSLSDRYTVTALDNGGFVVLWTAVGNSQVSYTYFDSNGQPLGPSADFMYSQGYINSPVIRQISDNSFLLCFKSQGSGRSENFKHTVNCAILDQLGVVNNVLTLETYDFADTLQITKLADGNFAVISAGYQGESYNLMLDVLSPSLEVLQSGSIVNDDNSFSNPGIISLTNGQFSIFFYKQAENGYEVMYQKYSKSYQKLGNNQKLNSNSNLGRLDEVVSGLSGDTLAACWSQSDNSKMSLQYQLFDLLDCKDINTFTKAVSTYSLKDDLSQSINDIDSTLIYFAMLPQLGSLLTSSGNFIQTGIGYLFSDVYYKSPETQSVNNITYYIADSNDFHSSDCTITVNVCYPSCESCTAIGNDNNHTCSSCKADYKQLGNSDCFKTCPNSFRETNYYYEAKNNSCARCPDNCQQCSDGSSCLSCKPGYWFVNNALKDNCVTTCPEGYYLIDSTCLQCEFKDSDDKCINCFNNNTYFYQNNCIERCPSGLIPDTKNICRNCTGIVYKGLCYDNCPRDTYYDNTTLTCYTCKERNMISFNNTCISNCPYGFGYKKETNICINCKLLGLYFYKYTCVEVCPFGTVENNIDYVCDPLIVNGN
jgi:hypothetical protein